MSAYIFARVNVTNNDKYTLYLKATPETIAKYGGKFIVRGGEKLQLEGQDISERIVILEFPSFEKAKEWYYSKEYQDAKKLREGAAIASFTLVNGWNDNN
jgi:uncharacterized protein (DUF1330 family)